MFRVLNKIGLQRKFCFHKRSFCIEKSQTQTDDRKLLRELCSKIRFRKVRYLEMFLSYYWAPTSEERKRNMMEFKLNILIQWTDYNSRIHEGGFNEPYSWILHWQRDSSREQGALCDFAWDQVGTKCHQTNFSELTRFLTTQPDVRREHRCLASQWVD